MSDGESLEPPANYTVDIFDKEFDSNDEIFTSAIDDSSKITPNPLAELPTLQLSMQEKVQPPTPVEDSLSDEIGLQSPSPMQKSQPQVPDDSQNKTSITKIKVSLGPKLGEGMGAYQTYIIESTIDTIAYTVQRRYNDFLGLRLKLEGKYIRAGRIIPPLPEKNSVGMTISKMSGQNEQGSSCFEPVERRRAGLCRFLIRTTEHPVFSVDPDVREFLQSEGELPKSTNTSSVSRAGVLRLIKQVGQRVNKIAGKGGENDSWYDEKYQEIDCIDSCLRKLHSSCEALVVAIKDLAERTGSFANACALVGNCEEHNPSLRNCLVSLRDTVDKLTLLHYDQASTFFALVCEPIRDCIALIHTSINDVFHERDKVRQNWNHSQSSLNKKKELKGKMEMANKPDKASAADKEIAEWQAKGKRCQEELSNISETIKIEYEEYELNRVKEIKAIFISYLEAAIKLLLKVIETWESFLLEAKSIT